MRVLLKDLITERLGVPDNLLDIAENIYNRVLNDLENKIKEDEARRRQLNLQYVSIIPFEYIGEFKTGPVTFKQIKIDIKLEKDNQATGIQSAGAAFSFAAELTKQSNFKKMGPVPEDAGGEVDISLNFYVNPKLTQWDLLDYMVSNKSKIVSDLSHEFKHAFDHQIDIQKQRGTSAKSRELYNVTTANRGIEELNEFYFLVYYTFFIENLVRPVEFAAQLKQNGVTKKEFLKFLQESEIFKFLKQARDFSFDKMKKEMADNPTSMFTVRMIAQQRGVPIKTLTNEQLVDEILKMSYMSDVNKMLAGYGSHLQYLAAKMSAMTGVVGNDFVDSATNAMDLMVKDLSKYVDNPERFYKTQEKKINIAGDKMIRRLARLYDYI